MTVLPIYQVIFFLCAAVAAGLGLYVSFDAQRNPVRAIVIFDL